MGQIVSDKAKPKRCNANQLSQVPTPAAGEHILVSSNNSMNAAGQGNFDCYIVGDGTTRASSLPLITIEGDKAYQIISDIVDVIPNSNLINPSKVQYGKSAQGNGTATNSSYNTTDFIDVHSLLDSPFTLSKLGARYNGWVRVLQYLNSNLAVLGAENNINTSSSAFYLNTSLYPNTYYIRLVLYRNASGENENDFITNQIQLSATENVVPYSNGDSYYIKGKALQEYEIHDKSVTPSKTTFFEVIKNLFNPSDCSYNHAWNNVSNDYSTTGYIDVTDFRGKTLYLSYNNGIACSCRQMKVYSEEKVDITSRYANESGVYVANFQTWEIPQDVYFVRLAISATVLVEGNTKFFQVEANDIGIHEYMEYGVEKFFIPSEYFNLSELNTGNTAQMTSKLYLTDRKIDLFFSPLFKNWQFINNRFCRCSITNATVVRQFKDLLTLTPSSNGVLSVVTYDDSFSPMETKSVTTICTPASKTGALKILSIGSSITGHGIIHNWLKTQCGSGVEFIGTRHASINLSNYFEATGGWGMMTFGKYRTTKTSGFSPFWHPTTGRCWGVVGYWVDVMTNDEFSASSENANYYVTNGRKTSAIAAGFDATGYPQASGGRLQSGDIIYDDSLGHFVQYNGSSWTQIETPTNWGFDFVKYAEMWDIDTPDVFMMLELSTNDFRTSPNTPIFSSWNETAESIFVALKQWNPNIKIVMTIPISTFGGDYSLGEWVQRNNYRMYQSRLNQIENFDNRENENIYLIDDAIFFDEMYGYSLLSDNDEKALPNTQYTGNERLRVQISSPHPNTQGEYLLAEGLFGIIQYLRS